MRNRNKLKAIAMEDRQTLGRNCNPSHEGIYFLTSADVDSRSELIEALTTKVSTLAEILNSFLRKHQRNNVSNLIDEHGYTKRTESEAAETIKNTSPETSNTFLKAYLESFAQLQLKAAEFVQVKVGKYSRITSLSPKILKTVDFLRKINLTKKYGWKQMPDQKYLLKMKLKSDFEHIRERRTENFIDSLHQKDSDSYFDEDLVDRLNNRNPIPCRVKYSLIRKKLAKLVSLRSKPIPRIELKPNINLSMGRKFLSTLRQLKMKYLSLKGEIGNPSQISTLVTPICALSHQISRSLSLSYFKISQKNFQAILKSGKNLCAFVTYGCKIQI